MARLRIETAPEITVYDEAFVIKAAANASAPLIQLKDSSGTVVGNITSTGTLNVTSVVASNAGSSSTDLATRAYVDTVAAGMNWHGAVEYATAAALPACTYANGTNGVGATLTGNANGRLTVDGSPQTTGKSVLVKNQADAKQNGIYYITAQGVDGSAPFVLTRRSDTDNNIAGQVKAGDAVYVINGSNNGGQAFTLTSAGTGTGGAIALGTDDLTYTQFTGTATFTAGNGLVSTNNVLDIGTASSNRIVVNANNIDLATVNQTNTGGSNTTSFVSSLTVDSYGRITGTETSSVSFSGYATLASPDLTGVPTAPTAANGTSNTQIATTNFVQNAATQAVSDAGNNAILKTFVTTKGDLIGASAANTPARVAVGSNNQLLVANSSATAGVSWATFSPVITLGGDLTGNVTLTNLANATLTATIAANSVALGTDTTGNYMVNVAGGTGITVSHTQGEGSTATVSINTAVTADLTTAQTLANKTFTTPNIGVATATSVNKVTITAPATSATLTLANGSSLITSGAFDTTITTTANTTVTLPTSGTLATTGNLSQFSSTTSSQLAGIISDETGTGNLVFSNSPVLVTPNIGTPSAATLTNATGLPIATGVSGLATGVATFLTTPSSANLFAALTDDTGTGLVVFNTSPNINTSITTSSATFNLINSTATTVNFAGAATTLAIGSASANTTLNGNVTISGNLTVSGTSTIINATTITVADKNVELANVSSPTNTTADGAGITIKGATDKTLNWVNATTSWTSSENFDLASGKDYRINNTSVLSNTTLGSGVVTSSLTAVGNVTTGTWSSTLGAVSGASLTNLTAGNLTGTIPSGVLGNSTHYIGTTAVTLSRASSNLALTGISSVAFPGSTSGTITLQANATAGTTTITMPATTGTLITTGDTGTVTSTMIADATIVNADISTTAAIAISKLASGTSGQVILANATGVPTYVTPSGDVTWDNTGNVQIAAGAIVNADISASAAIDQGKIADTTINAQSASYTLVLTDKNKMVEISNASATTLTVPADNTVNMATGATLTILQTGAGQITIAGASGVTVNGTPGLKLRTQWSSATLIKRAANTWVALGDLSA
jgi:hypothetical protein